MHARGRRSTLGASAVSATAACASHPCVFLLGRRGSLYATNYALAFHRGWPFIDAVNTALLGLYETGVSSNLVSKYYSVNVCQPSAAVGSSGVEWSGIAGVFVTLAGLVAFVILVFLVKGRTGDWAAPVLGKWWKGGKRSHPKAPGPHHTSWVASAGMYNTAAARNKTQKFVVPGEEAQRRATQWAAAADVAAAAAGAATAPTSLGGGGVELTGVRMNPIRQL